MYVFAYYIVFAMRNESTMVNRDQDIVFLFFIEMRDSTIYLIWLDHVLQLI